MGKFEKKCKREENVKICGLKTENISKNSAGRKRGGLKRNGFAADSRYRSGNSYRMRTEQSDHPYGNETHDGAVHYREYDEDSH